MRNPVLSTFIAIVAALVFSISAYADEPTFFGPDQYLCFDSALTSASGDCEGKDSPFKDLSFDYFYLEDFEDGEYENPVNTLGVAAFAGCGDKTVPSGQCPFLASEYDWLAGYNAIDSVDEDDGAIDGFGRYDPTTGHGQSIWAKGSPNGIRFEFDSSALGGLPTHVGVVWTDGEGDTFFEAYDADGNLLGTVGPVDLSPPTSTCSPDCYTGQTDDDHFFGVIYESGISKIRITNSQGGIEVDHLQYGKLRLEITVTIDIKPGSDPNCFNNDGHGVIPVAILSECPPGFDATEIDPATVELAGLPVRAVGKSNKLQAHIEDVNGDGCDDLVVQIEDIDGTFMPGTATATVVGNLFDGTPITGTDEICVVP